MSAQNEVGRKKMFFFSYSPCQISGICQEVFPVVIESPWPSEIVKQVLGFSEMWGILQGIAKTRVMIPLHP